MVVHRVDKSGVFIFPQKVLLILLCLACGGFHYLRADEAEFCKSQIIYVTTQIALVALNQGCPNSEGHLT